MPVERFVCIHGHFYQPPRENPWLEDVEIQDSAYPYHDWNERITFECYAPNTASRLLDDRKRIAELVDNYRRISFDFGPTLLTWLERKAPDVHAKIVESDRLSVRERSGHGNALAHVYNHVIMPLASRRDKVTQVVWGIKDFRRRFGRDPEGMWLAETAVDAETLDILAENGIRFTILSPEQARKVRPLSPAGTDWLDVSGGRVDPSRAYRWTSPKGRSLALFFYDAPISRAVAFEGLLSSGEALAGRLLSGFSAERTHPQLVHIATDGESYGHHHRFGDMALAYALRKIQQEGGAEVTNYGEFLSRFPPEWEVQIVENSSWSCAHGVERWNSDCGCRIGYNPHWTQAWRGPLRQSLNRLGDAVDKLYENKAGSYLSDPWSARDGYLEVVLDRAPASRDAFFARHQSRELSPGDRVAALKLLEMQRHRLLMFTSCAWFFDEISGIETVAVLLSAARALQLAQEHSEGGGLEEEFLAGLSQAKSNLPDLAHGAGVYKRLVKPVVTDLSRVAAHQAVRGLLQEEPPEGEVYCYSFRHLDRKTASSDGNALAVGRIHVSSRVTGEVLETSYAALHLGGHDFHCVLNPGADPAWHDAARERLFRLFLNESLTALLGALYRDFQPRVFSLQDLLLEERRHILGLVIGDILGRYDDLYRLLVDENRKLMGYLRQADMLVPEAFRLALQYVLNQDMKRLMGEFEENDASFQGFLRIRHEANAFGLSLNWPRLEQILLRRLEDRVKGLLVRPDPGEAGRILLLLDLCEGLELRPSFWKIENDFYDFCRGPFLSLPAESRAVFERLAERLNVRLSDPAPSLG